MSSINRIFSATVWTIVYNVINAVYNFVAVPLLISHYGKEEYGLIGLALSINNQGKGPHRCGIDIDGGIGGNKL